jgi:hypothetical protein
MHRRNLGRRGQMPPPPIYFLLDNSYFGNRVEEWQINKIIVKVGRDACVLSTRNNLL